MTIKTGTGGKRQRSIERPQPDRVVFLQLFLGGTGKGAMRHCHVLSQDAPFAKHACFIDTERPQSAEGADSSLCIGLDGRKVDAIQADPALLGPVAKIMTERHPEFLDPHSIKHGSRTFRPLTQLAVEYHLKVIKHHIYACVRSLMRISGATEIQPILANSTGGGAGSALAVVLAQLLTDPAYVALCTEGFNPYLLAPPVLVGAEPFAYSLEANEPQADAILGNAYAYRLEIAELQRRRAIQYAFFCGLANLGGAMIDSEQEITRNLGAAVFALCRNWSYLKARFVDTTDNQKTKACYSGNNVPEAVFTENLPSFAAPPSKQRHQPRITVTLGGNGHA